MRQENAFYFFRPVQPQEDGAPNYFNVIVRPMCILQVQEKMAAKSVFIGKDKQQEDGRSLRLKHGAQKPLVLLNCGAKARLIQLQKLLLCSEATGALYHAGREDRSTACLTGTGVAEKLSQRPEGGLEVFE
jgi:hypothetical protein